MKKTCAFGLLALFLGVSTAHANKAKLSDSLFVQKGLKYAVTEMDQTAPQIRQAILENKVKETFLKLFGVKPQELILFLDLGLLDHAARSVMKELTLPTHKKRLLMLSELLWTCAEHKTLKRLFQSYETSTKVMVQRQNPGMLGIQTAISKGLERTLPHEIEPIFLHLMEILDTQEVSIEISMQIFKKALDQGLQIVPVEDMQEWFDLLWKTEPLLFQSDQPRVIRRAFSNPHYLYPYLKTKDPKHLLKAAQDFLELYEDAYQNDSERMTTLSPKDWINIYATLKTVRPEWLMGVFSLPENAIFYDFYELSQKFQNGHILNCSEIIAEAHSSRPMELLVVLKYILQKQKRFTDQEISKITPHGFMALLKSDELPHFKTALARLKAVNEIVLSLEKHLLLTDTPPSEDTILWAENAVDKSLQMIDQLWVDLDLPVKNIDAMHAQGGLSPDNVDRILFTRNVFAKLFGEDYAVSLQALRTHLRQMRLPTLRVP